MRAFPPRSVAIAKTRDDDQAWRGRTLIAGALMATGVLAFGAASADWSEGAAMALGQVAGLVAPLGVIGAAIWAVAAFASHKS